MMLAPFSKNRFPFFGDFDPFFSESGLAHEIPLDLHEDEKEYRLTAMVPRVKREDVHIEFRNQVLELSYEFKTESEGKTLFKEFVDGKFQRRIRLPYPVDEKAISAKMEQGVLTVVLPKTEEAKPRSIAIR